MKQKIYIHRCKFLNIHYYTVHIVHAIINCNTLPWLTNLLHFFTYSPVSMSSTWTRTRGWLIRKSCLLSIATHYPGKQTCCTSLHIVQCQCQARGRERGGGWYTSQSSNGLLCEWRRTWRSRRPGVSFQEHDEWGQRMTLKEKLQNRFRLLWFIIAQK